MSKPGWLTRSRSENKISLRGSQGIDYYLKFSVEELDEMLTNLEKEMEREISNIKKKYRAKTTVIQNAKQTKI